MNNKCVFLDKDGTLIVDVPYNTNTELIVLYDDIIEPLKQLQTNGYKFIIISNQAGLAKELFTEDQLHKAFGFIISELRNKGIEILDYAYCPHDTDKFHQAVCSCRKPNAKLFLDMAIKHRINLDQSWMVGDILSDVIAGNKAGCRTILIDRLRTEIVKTSSLSTYENPTFYCKDFAQVDKLIINYKNNEDGTRYLKSIREIQ